MNERLMQVVADLLVFLGYCDDDVLDPDAALEQIDGAARLLGKLSAADRGAMATYLKTLAKKVRPKDRTLARRYGTLFRQLGLDEGTAGAKAKGRRR